MPWLFFVYHSPCLRTYYSRLLATIKLNEPIKLELINYSSKITVLPLGRGITNNVADSPSTAPIEQLIVPLASPR